jgi:hypothetical protein
MVMPYGLLKWITAITSGLALASIAFAIWGFGEKFDPQNKVKVAQALVLCAWILLPPIFFIGQWIIYQPTDNVVFGRRGDRRNVSSDVSHAIVQCRNPETFRLSPCSPLLPACSFKRVAY